MAKLHAFMFGVIGFLLAASVVSIVWLLVSEIGRASYDRGFKCGRYHICGGTP